MKFPRDRCSSMDERETERERERERESEHRLYCDAPTINQYDPRRAATPFAIMCDSLCTFACVAVAGAAAVAAATEARNLMNIKKKKELEKKREKKKRVTYKESQRQALRIRHTIYRSVSRRLLAL